MKYQSIGDHMYPTSVHLTGCSNGKKRSYQRSEMSRESVTAETYGMGLRWDKDPEYNGEDIYLPD